MKQFIITMAGVFAGLVLFVIGFFVWIAVSISSSVNMASKGPATPDKVVLALDLRQPMTDQHAAGPFGFFGSQLSTLDVIRKLDAAVNDPKVKGVYVRASTGGLDPAQAEEIRTALNKVRASKKFVISHIQNDSLQSSLAGYMAVAGSDEVWLQETGDMMPMGIATENMYFGGTLEKFRAKAQFEAREEYKDAITQYTEKAPTGPSRESTMAMITSIYGTALNSIATDRKMTLAAAKAAVEGTPYSGADAVKVKLIDKLGRPEDAAQAALDKGGDGAEFLELAKYKGPSQSGGATIALVTAEGEIVSGPPTGPSFNGGPSINSDQVSQALLDAAEDDDVKAIVFRVSSPGGSAVASDQISHAVELAQKKGKKVVVSMGPYAASGGYYISAGADSIVALPTTITGSIGIFGGKIVLGDTLEHYAGVTTASQSIGSPYITMFDSMKPFTPDQRKQFAAMIDRGYADFLGVVSKGRKMTPEKARENAKGRVWTGEQAKARGLVDELGGMDVAIARAKVLAGLKPTDKVTLKTYPAELNPFEQLESLFGVSGEAARAALVLSSVMGDERVEAVTRAAAMSKQTGLRAETPPMTVH